MRIALLGYGKMGREIESVALSRGHEIVLKVTSDNTGYTTDELKQADVAIEFSKPEYAETNIRKCFDAGIPVVVGTTGWYEKYQELSGLCREKNQALLCATNFSVGVNIFFEINRKLAEIMNVYPEYEPEIEEIHHTRKLDSPSGTAITIAEGIIENYDRKKEWINERSGDRSLLNILSQRLDNIPGTHVVRYTSAIDDIEIKHVAHNRKGFAAGAVIAAEWIKEKKGVYSMKDVLGI